MATIDPKTNVGGLNRSEIYQKHHHNIIKPNHDKTADKWTKTPTFKDKFDEKSLFPPSPKVLTPGPFFSMVSRSS